MLFDSVNAGYVQAIYEEWVRNPSAVDESWRRYFEAGGAPESMTQVAPAAAAPATAPAAPAAQPPAAAPAAPMQLRTAIAAAGLVEAYRKYGHRAARLDPLGSEPVGDPMLDPEYHGVTREELAQIPADLLGLGHAGKTMADALDWLESVYTGTIGYEYEHLESAEQREWLREAIESGEYRRPLDAEEKKRLLGRLSEAEAFEHFLHKAYLGQKRFSGEGNDMMVPMLDLAVERAAASGAREVIIGMAHRGRLNVLTHVVGMPYKAIIGEFEGKHAKFGITGDVKYHLGAEGTFATESGNPLTVSLAPNPSHLEFVNPVVNGMSRARQTRRDGREAVRDESLVLPILIHGDAAFAGQGVVPESLNMSRLEGYRVGGTLHLIANNQIGFTTDPVDSRSTQYSSDVARGFDIPVFHVNADDPEACLAVIRLALAFRERFRADVVIDMIGYRRWGHNEGDEPMFTQPILYERITNHPTVRKLWADRLVQEGVVTAEEAQALYDAAYQRLVDAQAEVKDDIARNGVDDEVEENVGATSVEVDTRVSAELLLSIDRQLHTWPEDFKVLPKLKRQLERKAKALPEGGTLDWAHAEALAFGSLLAEGTPVRLTGEDVQRGTFSQRHLVLHDVETGEVYTPMANLQEAKAPFEVYNSPLTELATMGFEYGFSVAWPDALVLWEAQFGDFANGAQIIIDQFIAAGRAKWGQESSLVLLLPHGYEGQGPEHSSARIERFLQLAGEGEIRVADCTTPAQYFHLLRRQVLSGERRPLVIFTPKSLLRHPRATSTLTDLVEGSFQPVIDDERAAKDQVTRLLLCTGKVYYDLIGSDAAGDAAHVGIARVEELYPFPGEELARVIAGYPSLEEVVWV